MVPSPKKNSSERTSSSANLPKLEEEVLQFWQKEKIFERSVNERPADKAYVFYDGPPYATGKPHIGGMLASVLKDVVPRYKTMRGYRVERRFGWDCHGLPIEVLVEKELGLHSKKEIETFGIQKFNDECRAIVLRYVNEWRSAVDRVGRWVDFENDYKTMDLPYMESAIWVFAELYKKGLVYQDYRTSLYCTRCETPLSKMETSMDDNYRDIDDVSVYVAFQSIEDPNLFYMAWTTTPWTLSANVALAIREDLEYAVAELSAGEEGWIGRKLVMAKDLVEKVLPAGSYRIVQTMTGAELLGKKYNQLQSFMPGDDNSFRIVAADFVSAEDGTGIIHIAPAFGEDDFEVSKKEQLPILLTINDAGLFLPEITPWAGQHIKAADPSIIAALKKDLKILKTETIRHSYPFCWRCGNPLIYKVQESWYIKVEAVKEKMLATNEDIHWVPEHLKQGRFRQGMETAPDWGVSRSRFWGIPIPVWRCDRCSKEKVVGSLDELEQCAGKRPDDLHRPGIDTLVWACACGGTYARVPEVCDVWFDSGTMPYGQLHYPFEQAEKFEATFPADFITEYIPQTRGWFYVMHVLGNALFGKAAFRNVLATGTILASDGTKMSKSKGNFPDLAHLFDTYGADAFRLYLVSSPVVQGDDVMYVEENIVEQMRKVLLPLWNVFSFFLLYAPPEKTIASVTSEHVLDRWIMARLEETRKEIEDGMEGYELWRAVRPIAQFVTDLSTWYVRRSRDRFKGDSGDDREAALSTLFTVLLETTKLFAPFIPFISETLYQKLKPWNTAALDSVHLEAWPAENSKAKNEALLLEMAIARRIIELGHGLRAQEKIKVRQPLARVWVEKLEVPESLKKLVLEELNVSAWGEEAVPKTPTVKTFTDEAGTMVALDIALTPELKLEGMKRELVRQINAKRKAMGLTIQDRIRLVYSTESEPLKELLRVSASDIAREVLADILQQDVLEHSKEKEDIIINGEHASIEIAKISSKLTAIT